ncbi:hypothetical protein D9M72_487010 [compost metagenome]
MTEPGIDGGAALVEGHRLAALVAEGGHGHGTQLAGADGGGDAAEIQLASQQLTQGGVIQQRHRDIAPQSQQAVTEETRTLAEHAGPVAAVDRSTVKALPDTVETADGLAKVQCTAGQTHGIHRAGGGTDDDWKRIAGSIRQQVGDGAQHPDLIGRPRTATGKNQPGNGLLGGGAGIHGRLSGRYFPIIGFSRASARLAAGS